ncbi:response regulator transcription factor [Hymenobacter sp. BT770]|uniref:response regulator n=1 Tax=Hymenobacter sp. BT770 TaxID=2886942 RepID=UPI001D12B430|nr:response regulator transcription factor [Hymenobacter sp. BT770]MCC3154981.1 response regulator transcription factor [Hymenobacter sp. BT770]MDO3416877.1 response regulator transcription factor [Hymenobacter sp. BT770]
MIRVLLVDDHAILRSGLRSLLADQPGLEVVGEAGRGEELLQLLPTTPADVVLLDLNMPGMEGVEIIRQLRAHHPAVQVLVLTVTAGEERVIQMLSAGAHGYLLKSAGLKEMVYGIRTVAAGHTFLCSEVGLATLQKLHEGAETMAKQLDGLPVAHRLMPADPPVTLSRRELEVLRLVADGFTNQEMADLLFTSKRTIETHRQNIITKTGAKNTASLIRLAISEGLIS